MARRPDPRRAGRTQSPCSLTRRHSRLLRRLRRVSAESEMPARLDSPMRNGRGPRDTVNGYVLDNWHWVTDMPSAPQSSDCGRNITVGPPPGVTKDGIESR